MITLLYILFSKSPNVDRRKTIKIILPLDWIMVTAFILALLGSAK